MIRVHLTTGHLDAELFPHNSTKNVQGRMRAHHLITKLPVDSANDLGSDSWWWAVDGMPDNVITLIHGYYIGLFTLIVPANCATICHLTTSARVEDGCIQCDFITFYRDHS